MRRALVIGCSDGIGLALVRALLAKGWAVAGCSRSDSPVVEEAYVHRVLDVRSPGFGDALRELIATRGPFDACVYCAGIGETLDPSNLEGDVAVFEVNLVAAVSAAAVVIPGMVRAGAGHFVVLSSQADELVSAEAPSYGASKAALSAYFEGLGLALRSHHVTVTNVRLGFVDTKMAKATRRPFLVSPERAAAVVLRALDRRAIRITYPARMAVLIAVLRWLTRWRVRIA